MKKLLLFLLGAPLLTLAGWVAYKIDQNPTMAIPYPYIFENTVYKDLEVDAPIVIIGDRMGKRLSNFSNLLAQEISKELTTPIKVISIAENGEGIHRTLQKVKKLKKLPLFLIYLGGGEETYEKKFENKDISKILANFEYYNDDLIQSILMVFPILSRFLYDSIDRQRLSDNIIKDTATYTSEEIIKRNEIEFFLYKFQLDELFNFAKEHNSAVIAISHPINLDIGPNDSCEGTIDEQGNEKLTNVLKLVNNKDFKSAFKITNDLALMYPNNARVLFLNGKIAKRLGMYSESQKYLELSSAFDCGNWRATPVYNGILKNVAKENEIFYYDFNRYLKDNWTKNLTFEDEIFPQNFYMEKVVETLAVRIKKVLKL